MEHNDEAATLPNPPLPILTYIQQPFADLAIHALLVSNVLQVAGADRLLWRQPRAHCRAAQMAIPPPAIPTTCPTRKDEVGGYPLEFAEGIRFISNVTITML